MSQVKRVRILHIFSTHLSLVTTPVTVLLVNLIFGMVLISSGSSTVFGQSSESTLSGRVTDTGGAVIVGAKISLVHDKTFFERQTETDSNGGFKFESMAPGDYKLKVSGKGFISTIKDLSFTQSRTEDVILNTTGVAEEVTVTATRSAAEISTVPGAVSIISRERFDDQSQTSTGIADVLAKTVPGLAPSNQSLSTSGQTLRGRPFQVLIDGIPQSTTRNVSRDLESIDRASIERVEVLRGPTAIYGDGATGGIINIITRTPTEERLRFNTDLGTSFSLSHPNNSPGGYIRQGISGKYRKLSFIANGVFEKNGALFDANGDRIPPDPNGQGGLSDTRKTNAFGKLGFSLTSQQHLQFTFNRFVDTQDTDFTSDPVVDSMPGRQKARALRGLRLEEEQGTKNTFLNFDYTNDHILHSRLHAQAYYRDFFTRFFPNDGRAFVARGNQIIQSFVDSIKRGGRLEISTPVIDDSRLTLLYGADFASEGTVQPVLISDPAIFDATNGLVFRTIDSGIFTPPIAQRNFGLFLQSEWHAMKRLILRGGVRRDNIKANIPTFTTLGKNTVPGGELDYASTLFNAGAVFDITDTVNIFGNFSQGFSIADIGRILREAGPGFTVISLRPEAQKVNNFETGVRLTRSILQSSLSLFYNTSNLGSTFAADFSTIRAPERVYGAEAEIDVQPLLHFRFGGTATWIEGKNDVDRDGVYS
ncbi:MAG: TonB-dependent receptor, partial [Pyrinomonadaceae bacterium]